MALQGVKRTYKNGSVDYAIVVLDSTITEVKFEESEYYTQELCDIEEVIHSQYNGYAWLTTEPSPF